MPRLLAPGQRSRIHVLDVDTGEDRILHESRAVLYEAPNWTLDGAMLILNGDGHLFRLAADGSWLPPNVVTVPAAGGEATWLTDDEFADDGAEYSPDGAWLYFNSERGGTAAGRAQLFRMRPDGTGPEQLTHDERVNWFPHVSPDGARLAYVSFPPGTQGHPADRDVLLRLCAADGSGVRDLVRLRGGQGTMNVNSWAPDSRRLAYVDYPVDA